MTFDHPSGRLAHFAATLRFEDLPLQVVDYATDLFVDWLGSALAGKGAAPVEAIASFARDLSADGGGFSEILINRTRTHPYFAAMVNAAASHFAEQDDIHNGSVFHPGTVVFPVALALAQQRAAPGADLLTAAVVGYEVGIRVGEFLGRSHYRVFHTTGTAGTFAAAATAGRLLGLSPEQMLHAFGSAGTQASGLWEFLRDAADSKQLHTAKAAANGLMAAELAYRGFTGASHILEGPQGIAAAMSTDADNQRLVDLLGTRWATVETSFKYHASCRHTHAAADALIKLLRTEELEAADVEEVTVGVHGGAHELLGRIVAPSTVHQAKFHMGTVLALVAIRGCADVSTFDEYWRDPEIEAFAGKVRMRLDHEVNAAYPARWIAKVTVRTRFGNSLEARVDVAKGDPGNSLTAAELHLKFCRLARYQGALTEAEIAPFIRRARGVRQPEAVSSLFDDLAAISDLAPVVAEQRHGE